MIESICNKCIHRNVCGFYEPYEECGACNHFTDKSRFVELPCKVGDTVYMYIANKCGKRTFSFNIVEICIYEDEIIIFDDWENGYHPEDFGKNVFLTREEAEAALAERRNENEKRTD